MRHISNVCMYAVQKSGDCNLYNDNFDLSEMYEKNFDENSKIVWATFFSGYVSFDIFRYTDDCRLCNTTAADDLRSCINAMKCMNSLETAFANTYKWSFETKRELAEIFAKPFELSAASIVQPQLKFTLNARQPTLTHN